MASYLQFIYCSRRSVRDDEARGAEVRDILAVARDVNARSDITGALLVDTDCFAQLLEGPADKIEELFARIRVDSRHRDVVVLSRQTVAERAFPDWSMGFAAPAGTHQIDVAARVFANAFYLPGQAAAAEVLDLIQSTIEHVQVW